MKRHSWNSLSLWVLPSLPLFTNHGRNNNNVLASAARGGGGVDRDVGVDLHCTLNLEGVAGGEVPSLKSFCVINVLFRPSFI